MPRLIEPVQRAGLLELSGKRGGGVGIGLGLIERRQDLARRHGADIGPARLGGEAQGFLGSLELGLLETDAGDLRPRRPHRQRQDRTDDLALDIELDRIRHPLE